MTCRIRSFQTWLLTVASLGAILGDLGTAPGQGTSSPGTLTEHVTFRRQLDVVWSLAFAPDNRTLAAGLADGTVRIWDVVEGKEVAVLRGHKDVVRSVAFSPDSKLLASGSKDGTIKFWSWERGPDQGKLLDTLDAHKGRVLSVAFAPNGKLLASGSFDGTVKVWDVATRKVKMSLDHGTVPGVFPAEPRRASSVAFSPNGRVLGVVAGDIGKLWDVTTGRAYATLSTPGFYSPGVLGMDSFGEGPGVDSTSAAQFTPSGRYFTTTWGGGSKDRAPLKLWDSMTGRPRDLLQIRQVSFNVALPGGLPLMDTRGSENISTFALSNNGKLVATGGHEFPLTGKEKTIEDVRKLEERMQNRYDYLVKLWDTTNGKPLARLKGHQAIIRAMAFSPDSTLLATGGQDQTIRVWVVARGLADKAGP